MTSIATTMPSAYYQAFETSQSCALATGTALAKEQAIPVHEDEQILAEARQQTYDLQFLAPGWNGYDVLPPSGQSIRHAMHWLIRSYAECKDAGVRWYKPNVTASAEGEVVFEWWADDRILSIYIDETGASFHKSQGGAISSGEGVTEHTHGSAPLGEEQAELLRWFGA